MIVKTSSKEKVGDGQEKRELGGRASRPENGTGGSHQKLGTAEKQKNDSGEEPRRKGGEEMGAVSHPDH